MPLFVMIGEYTGDLSQDLLDKHIAWLVPQFEAGTFLVSGGLDAVADRPASALAIMEAESREAALEILDTEPFFLAGRIAHDVVPFHARVRGVDLDARFSGPDLLRIIA
jgi:uncharacterized protein YciI